MSFVYLLDTSVWSQPIKDRPVAGVLERWSEVGDESVCTSSICLAEVLQGLEERGSSKYWRRYHELLEHRYKIMSFDEASAVEFSRLNIQLRRMGKPKPAMDLLIASIARRHGLTLATLNYKDFEGIPGLKLEDWLEPA